MGRAFSDSVARAAMLLHFEREVEDRDQATAKLSALVDCSVGVHGAMIDRLIDVVEDQRGGREFIAAFAELSSLRYRAMRCFPQARYWADLGLKERPRAPNLLVARGMIDDLLAREGERVWSPIESLGRRGRHLSLVEALDREGRHSDARDAFEAALAIEPSHCEAALRLGRLRLEAKQIKRGQPLLTGAASRCSPRTRYLAWLFLGRASEDAGDVRTAIDAYENAGRVLPTGQSAAVALAHAEAAAGDIDRAREILERSVAAAGTRTTLDPISTYFVGDDDAVNPLFAALFTACAK